MNSKLLPSLVAATFFSAFFPSAVNAAALYSQNFDVDDSANWTVNKSTGVNANDANSSAEFFFDYSTMGVPSAPNSGGTTRGLRLRANMAGNIFSGLSVSPTGQSFSGNYQLRFDMWLNYNGRLDGGGNGTTVLAGAGLGTGGTIPQWAGGTQDSIWFASTVDGGSASDYRAYSSAAATSYPAGNAVYAAPGGGINNSAAYYTAAFPSKIAPAAQLALYPQQTNATLAGTLGFAWHDVTVTKNGSLISWAVDGTLLATIDSTGLAFSNDILFNFFDSNATSSTDPNAPALTFGLFDNITVAVIPEPSVALLAGAALAGYFVRRRNK